MPTYIATASDGRFPDDQRLESPTDLIAELADQAAQGALINYQDEDWRRSPLRRMLEAAVGRLGAKGRKPSAAVAEALDKFRAAGGPVMAATEYKATLRMLGLQPGEGERLPGVTRPACFRYARGLEPIPGHVAETLRGLVHDGVTAVTLAERLDRMKDE